MEEKYPEEGSSVDEEQDSTLTGRSRESCTRDYVSIARAPSSFPQVAKSQHRNHLASRLSSSISKLEMIGQKW